MAGLGAAELLVLLMLSMGGGSPDLISLIPAEGYFQSRGIALSVPKMIELAGKVPVDGKTQTAQLLALRFLASDAAKLKKDNDYARAVDLLEQIAQGKKAQDKLGFAKEYATAALARLKGKQPMLPTLPDNSTRDEALRWFPADSSLVGCLDLRGLRFASPNKELKLSSLPLFGFIGLQNDMFSKLADAVGNVRIDRFSFAYADVPQNNNQSRFFYRMSGKVDHKRLVNYLQKDLGVKVQSRVGSKGEAISILDIQPGVNGAPSFALIGDSDLVLGGYPMQNQGKHEEVLEQTLALQAGKGLPVTNGLLKGDLQNTSAKAAALLVGELPQEFRKALALGGGELPLKALPQRLTCELIGGKDRLDVRFSGIFDNAADAKSFREGVLKLKDDGIKAVKNLPEQVVPKNKKDSLLKVFDSLTVEGKGANAGVGVVVPLATIRQWAELAIPGPGPALPKE
jgi:hypothetical protein